MLLGYSCRHESYLVSLVCTWRHGGHVGCQEQKHFSPLESKLFFHVNSSRKFFIANMAALSHGWKPRISWTDPTSDSSRLRLRSVTGIAPKSPFLRVTGSPIQYGAGAKAIQVVWTHPQWCIANPAPAYKLFMKNLCWLLSKNHFH